MKRNKPKLFTAEFVNVLMLLLSLAVGSVTILVYRDRLPLWVIIIIGFWYPISKGLLHLLKRGLKTNDGDL